MGKSKFETEYSSKYKEYDSQKLSILKSPVLKPRNVSSPIIKYFEKKTGKENKPVTLPSSEAGLMSSHVHLAREPALQHKTIVNHPRNHNISSTKTTKQFEEQLYRPDIREENKFGDTMANKSESSRAQEMYSSLKLQESLAGRPSDTLGYLAKEPPIQGKSRPSFHRAKMDHVSGALMFDEPPSEELKNDQTYIEPRRQSKDKVQRKLEFKEVDSDGPSTKNIEKIKPENTKQKAEEVVVSPQILHRSPVKSQSSPLALRRKEDLKEAAEKQSERVDRALKIKAGLRNIEPPLYSHPRKTEYQREFGWKRPIMFTPPVLSAEKVVFKSNPSLQPLIPVASGFPRKTEYQSVYESPVLKVEPRSGEKSDTKEVSTNDSSPAGLPSGKSVEDRRRERQSNNANEVKMPPHPRQRYVTEYRGNYCSPTKFRIRSGAWIGDFPPHLQVETPDLESKSDNSEWFKEVLRLRDKAREFRARTDETHFPTRFGSVSSSTSTSRSVSAMSMEADSLGDIKEGRSLAPEKNTQGTEHDKVLSRDNDATRDKELISCLASEKSAAENPGLDPHIESNPANNAGSTMEDSDTENETMSGSLNGRLPTPRLKKATITRRHHLDPTTPTVGGALLVSPSKTAVDQYRPSKPAKVAWVNMDDNGIISDDPEPGAFAASSVPHQTLKGKPGISSGKGGSGPCGQDIKTKGSVGAHTYKVHKGNNIDRASKKSGSGTSHNYDSTKYASREHTAIEDSNDASKTACFGKAKMSSENQENSESPLSPSSMSARSSIISDIHDRSLARRRNFWT